MVNVFVSGAAGQIGYALLPLLANGRVFGPNEKVHLRLLDIEQALEALKGVAMELEDGGYPTLGSVIYTADPEVALRAPMWQSSSVGSHASRAWRERTSLQ